MKIRPLFLLVCLGLSGPLYTSCSTAAKKKPATPAVSGTSDGKSAKGTVDDLDEYSANSIPDPIEPVNRGTFWVNHQVYRYVVKPISRGYETIFPKPVRKGIYNVFNNVEFPVRFINNTLQGNFSRAGQETGKFLVDSTVGVGGLMRPSEKIPALANVPEASTDQTFAKWGIGHGCYLVLPLIGPSSLRGTAGLAGDYALNPITWIGVVYGTWAWTIPVSVADTISVTPDRLAAYDAATKNALDRYLAARTAYVQASEARKAAAFTK